MAGKVHLLLERRESDRYVMTACEQQVNRIYATQFPEQVSCSDCKKVNKQLERER